jgi:predicted PurR-regulated permease PerM
MTSLRPFIYLGSLALALGLLYSAKAILVPIALAVLLSFVLNPVVARLHRLGLNRVASVIFVTLLAVFLLGAIGIGLMLQIKELGEQLPQYQENIARKIAAFREAGKGNVLEKVQDTVIVVQQQLKEKQDRKDTTPEPVPVQVVPSNISELGMFVGPAAETFATAGLVMVLVVFMLIYREDLRGRMIQLIGHGRLLVTTRAIDEASQRISRFLVMQLVINAGVGIALGVGLFLIGVPYALLWGALAAAMRFIPYVGSWLVAALLIAFSVAVFPGWTEAFLLFALFVILELLTSQVMEPLLLGHSTGVTPVALLIAAVFWTWLWGPVGLAMSTPLTTCLVVLGKYVPYLEFLSILLGDEGKLDAVIGFYQRLVARDQDEAVGLIEDYLQDHPAETVYDDILVPALVLAKRDRARGELTQDDEQFIYQVTRDILNDILPSQPPQPLGNEIKLTEHAGPQAIVLGFPARDEADELTLLMFQNLLGMSQSGAEMEVLSVKSLASEMVARITDRPPTLVCIAATPPDGLAQARYLCKRLHSVMPGQKIIIGRWGGQTENSEHIRGRLLDACADQVSTTLIESRSQCLPLIQFATNNRQQTVPANATPEPLASAYQAP